MADSSAPWKNDHRLREALETHVLQGLQRSEVLDFVGRDFPMYEWSLTSLNRRLRFFEIYYNRGASTEAVRDAVQKELDGPGRLLGYRAMHKKVRQEYGLSVSRDEVYTVMKELDPEGLEARGGIGAKKRRKKGNFSSKGPNWVHSLDGHDKLMGYQCSTFPLAIYGCIDTASRKIMWLRIWTTNSDPKVIGRWYLEYLIETGTMPNMIRVDKGTETVTMAAMHAFLRRNHEDNVDPTDTVLYGPSTSNQIERWWKELHERLEKYFKEYFMLLKDQGYYDPHDDTDRNLLAFVTIPILQKELDKFKDFVWNNHRIRAQKDTILPDGVPEHIHSFPDKYGLEECGLPLTKEQLKEAAVHSGVLEIEEDFLEPAFRRECERTIPNPGETEPKNCAAAYMHLKRNFRLPPSS